MTDRERAQNAITLDENLRLRQQVIAQGREISNLREHSGKLEAALAPYAKIDRELIPQCPQKVAA